MGAVTIESGVATILDSGSTSSYMTATVAENSDLYNFKNKTVLIKARVDKGAMVGGFFAKENSFAYGIGNNGAFAKIYYNGSTTGGDGIEEINGDEYRMYAVTLEYDEVMAQTTITLYASNKENPTSADDFVVQVSSLLDIKNLEGTGDIYIGKRGSNHVASVRNLDTYVDDIKIFDGILTPAQMVAESPTSVLNGSTGGDTGNTGGDTGADTEPTPIIPVTPVLPGSSTTDTQGSTSTDGDAEATQTEAQATDSSAADTTAEEDGGCGSFVAIGVVGVVAVAAAISGSRKRRE